MITYPSNIPRTLSRLTRVCRAGVLAGALLCLATASPAAQELPPLPKGVVELKFSEFFASPVGPRGLELTDKLKALDGERVRILGYMVAQDKTVPGSFLLTPVPVQLHDHDSALADDLPATTVHVTVAGERAIGYTPQLLLLTGTLTVGNKPGLDGRISLVQLTLGPQQRFPRGTAKRVESRGGASALMRRK
jgi:hypothetical protein